MTNYKKPTNTSKLPAEALLAVALGSVDGPSSAIEHMEAEGQRQFVGSDSIPAEILQPYGVEVDVEAELQKLGFELGEVFPSDPLFRGCSLPPGWKRAGTDHSMHSDILDEYGRPRIGVFYKAAFYDRRASMSFLHCLRRQTDYKLAEETGGKTWREYVEAQTKEGPKILFEVVKETPDATGWLCDENRAARDEAAKKTEAFLTQNFPEHDNPFAYWDKDSW